LDSQVVGADSDVGGVDVSTQGGDHSVVQSLDERGLDSGGVDLGDQRGVDLWDDAVVEVGVVETSGQREGVGVHQGGVSLSLTLGDRRNHGGGQGLQSGEGIEKSWSVEGGVVDSANHWGLESGVVDSSNHWGLESGVVDSSNYWGLESGVVDSANHWGLESGVVDSSNHWGLEGGVVDQRVDGMYW